MKERYHLDANPEWGQNTLGVRAGQRVGEQCEHSPPIYATSSFVFSDAAEAAAKFAHEIDGNIYSRFTNPTVAAFERRLAAMEGAQSCVATSSGMSAVLATCMGLLEAGDHVVVSRTLFGSTISLFNNYLAKFGISFTFVSATDPQEWAAAVQDNTRMFFAETPTNPLTEVADIAALADIAHAHDCLLVVDNCFCTPVLQKPLALGADIVIHSATKFLDGQGRAVGGAVLGDAETVGERVFGFLRTAGPCLSPFHAWLYVKGLETLNIRMQAISATALKLATWLEEQQSVASVYYPGLVSHPQHELAARQQSAGGGIVAFEVQGGREAAWKLIDSTRLLSITANLGDTRTTITHPASTTHGRLTQQQRDAAGISEGLVRIAVGLEDFQDLQADLLKGMGD